MRLTYLLRRFKSLERAQNSKIFSDQSSREQTQLPERPAFLPPPLVCEKPKSQDVVRRPTRPPPLPPIASGTKRRREPESGAGSTPPELPAFLPPPLVCEKPKSQDVVRRPTRLPPLPPIASGTKRQREPESGPGSKAARKGPIQRAEQPYVTVSQQEKPASHDTSWQDSNMSLHFERQKTSSPKKGTTKGLSTSSEAENCEISRVANQPSPKSPPVMEFRGSAENSSSQALGTEENPVQATDKGSELSQVSPLPRAGLISLAAQTIPLLFSSPPGSATISIDASEGQGGDGDGHDLLLITSPTSPPKNNEDVNKREAGDQTATTSSSTSMAIESSETTDRSKEGTAAAAAVTDPDSGGRKEGAFGRRKVTFQESDSLRAHEESLPPLAPLEERIAQSHGQEAHLPLFKYKTQSGTISSRRNSARSVPAAKNSGYGKEAGSTCVEEAEGSVKEAEARVEEAAARVEEAEGSVEEAEARVEEAGARVEEAGARVEEATARVEEAEGSVEEAAARVEEAGARVEEAGARVEEAGSTGVDEAGGADDAHVHHIRRFYGNTDTVGSPTVYKNITKIYKKK